MELFNSALLFKLLRFKLVFKVLFREFNFASPSFSSWFKSCFLRKKLTAQTFFSVNLNNMAYECWGPRQLTLIYPRRKKEKSRVELIRFKSRIDSIRLLFFRTKSSKSDDIRIRYIRSHLDHLSHCDVFQRFRTDIWPKEKCTKQQHEPSSYDSFAKILSHISFHASRILFDVSVVLCWIFLKT